jgi:hypothetical protein
MQTIRKIFRVDRREISYLRSTIESYDGMAVVSTLDAHEAYIEIQAYPGCESLVLELLDSLRASEKICITEKAEKGGP